MANRSTTQRRAAVTPSIYKSETFLFFLFVLALAVYLPVFFSKDSVKPGGGSSAVNGTVPITATRAVAGAVQTASSQVPLILPQAPAHPPVGAAPSTQPSRPAPITYLIPYITSLISATFRLVKRLPALIYSLIKKAVFKPLSYPLSAILAILRPLTLLLEIIYVILLRTPLKVISWFVQVAIYPLYVFFGAAFLLGSLVGYIATYLPKGIQAVVYEVQARFPGSAKYLALGAPSSTPYITGGGEIKQESILGARSQFGEEEYEDGEEDDRETVRGQPLSEWSAIGTRERGRGGLRL